MDRDAARSSSRRRAWTRERDRLSQERRALPWVKVEKKYVFEGVEGPVTLRDLFEGRSQLVVYHFMFGPEWEEGCPGCSLLCDQVDGARQHFEHNDVSFAAVSRGPIVKLEAYRKRMGWKFRRVSSAAGDFNFDYHVSFPNTTRERVVFYNFAELPDPGMDELPGASAAHERRPDGCQCRAPQQGASGQCRRSHPSSISGVSTTLRQFFPLSGRPRRCQASSGLGVAAGLQPSLDLLGGSPLLERLRLGDQLFPLPDRSVKFPTRVDRV
jgi:predicted dithiol-disulfide oxidoreductase (DUF899 family)